LLEKDEEFEQSVREIQPGVMRMSSACAGLLAECHGRPSDVVVSSERHSLAMNLFEHVAKVKAPNREAFQGSGGQVPHAPYLGYVFLAGVLFSFFWLVSVWASTSKNRSSPCSSSSQPTWAAISARSRFFSHPQRIDSGFFRRHRHRLPYLIPFLLGLALLEDIGYLPRAAFLMDSIMHAIGLHGKSIIPFVLSYGCNVPAIMGVRIMERAGIDLSPRCS
jgi:ferrous iron transport protein B